MTVGRGLMETLRERGVTHVTLPPGVLAGAAEKAGFGSVVTLVVAGEASTRELVRSWGEGRRLINAYGPTEATVCASIEGCGPEGEGPPPIGRPIANARIYILDRNGEPAPVGVAGEVYIGGAGVARGYLNRPELTAERFVADPFVGEANERMYRAGDVGRYLPDGKIEYIGRNDFQVKIRGFRIELGEIEARLAEHAAVREAVVVAREDGAGDRRLVAYYTAASGEAGEASVKAEELREHVLAALPEYMVPTAYVALEAMPLTPNGKLDRKALPAPEVDAYAARGYEAPVGEIETALAEIWAEVLKLERVGRHDDFFALGGHSLLVVRLIERMRERGLHTDVRAFFVTPTVAALASSVMDESDVVQVPSTKIPNLGKKIRI
jgi:acyl-coenzyme A synthetase/AMP-(fatty) acid ligase/aryl carrier-like protein